MGRCVSQAADEPQTDAPRRSEVAEYVHDMAGQLAEMAEAFGLAAAAEALRRARSVVEDEF